MKKAFVLTMVFGLCVHLAGSDEKYYQKMGETLSGFARCTTVEDYHRVANTFANISRVNSTEWLPLYYEAQCFILMSFIDTTGAGQKDSFLDQAANLMNRLMEMAPDESEIHALQALYQTAWMVVNPAERSPQAAPLVNQAVARSLALDPANPRAKYIRLANQIGTAQFFGSDITPFCKSARELLASWDSFHPDSPIHPSWGKELVQQIVNNCQE